MMIVEMQEKVNLTPRALSQRSVESSEKKFPLSDYADFKK
jgi:hypothetical protein